MKNQTFLFVLLSGVCMLLFSCEEKLTPNETTEKVLKSATRKLQHMKGICNNPMIII